jgi:hypothetical protein
MIRRTIGTLSLMLVAASPLAAQGGMAGMHHDDDHKIAGGPLPAGWMGRADGTAKVEDAKFAAQGKGWHVTSGPAAVYWNDKSMEQGRFVASATIEQTKSPAHPEAYGLFFGGKDLASDAQTYYYMLVRGDGKVLVNHRAGKEVHKIMDWTDNAAVHKADAAGVAINMLTVDASKPDSVRLLVNGAQIFALGGSAEGIVGLRVNHNLDVQINDFVVTKK